MQTTAVQVRTAHRTEPLVHHHDFRMMKASIKHVDVCSRLTQLIGNIKSGIRSKRDVRLPRDHDFHPNSPFSRSFDSISDLTGRSKIRIDNLHLTFCSIQCRNIGLTHDFRTSFRNTLHNGHPSSGTLAQRVVWHLSFFQTFVRFLIPYT